MFKRDFTGGHIGKQFQQPIADLPPNRWRLFFARSIVQWKNFFARRHNLACCVHKHYARTLRHWHDNLRHVRGHLEQLGYDEHFYRLWEFYLCYCEGGFLERSIGTVQMLLARPEARPAPLLGSLERND